MLKHTFHPIVQEWFFTANLLMRSPEKLHGHWYALAYQIKEHNSVYNYKQNTVRSYCDFIARTETCSMHLFFFTVLNARGTASDAGDKIIADETRAESNNSRYESSTSVLSRFLRWMVLFIPCTSVQQGCWPFGEDAVAVWSKLVAKSLLDAFQIYLHLKERLKRESSDEEDIGNKL